MRWGGELGDERRANNICIMRKREDRRWEFEKKKEKMEGKGDKDLRGMERDKEYEKKE